MKVSQLLNENISMDEINSQKFMEDFEGLSLYHATTKSFNEIHELNFRFRKKPQTTITELHDAINKISLERFGLPIRNLLFCHPEVSTMFGIPYQIVPIGEFRMFYCPGVNDMTVDFGYENYYVFTYDNTEYVEKMMDMLPSAYTKELAEKIFDGEMVFVLDKSYLEDYVSDLRDDYGSEKDFDAFADMVYSNIEEIFQLQYYAINDIMHIYADGYVSNVEGIDTSNYGDITNEEIMVYAPNGFFVIPINE